MGGRPTACLLLLLPVIRHYLDGTLLILDGIDISGYQGETQKETDAILKIQGNSSVSRVNCNLG